MGFITISHHHLRENMFGTLFPSIMARHIQVYWQLTDWIFTDCLEKYKELPASCFIHLFPNGIFSGFQWHRVRTTSNLTSWSWSTVPKRRAWVIFGDEFCGECDFREVFLCLKPVFFLMLVVFRKAML